MLICVLIGCVCLQAFSGSDKLFQERQEKLKREQDQKAKEEAQKSEKQEEANRRRRMLKQVRKEEEAARLAGEEYTPPEGFEYPKYEYEEYAPAAPAPRATSSARTREPMRDLFNDDEVQRLTLRIL